MSKKDKLLKKLCMIPLPKDFTWQELLTLMGHFDFKETCCKISYSKGIIMYEYFRID